VTHRLPSLLLQLTALAASAALAAAALVRPTDRATAAPQAPRANDPPAAANSDRRADEAAVRKAFADYVAVLNKGDLDAVLAFWAPDADYIDESGRMTRSRDAIAALLKKSLPGLKGVKVTGRVHALKFLRPEIALVDGAVECAAGDGTRDVCRTAVVWTRSGDQWLISSARDLPAGAADVPSPAAPQLQPLAWLVGQWQDQSDQVDVRIVCRWAPNKSFLLMEYTVKREGMDPLEVRQRVGWDPLHGVIRSWVFDSTGGFGEAVWRRDGKRWVTSAEGVLPDGGTGTATNTYEFVDANAFMWRSTDREVDGQPMADVEVKFARQAAKQGGQP
jgi:uncharacterized protein (TIGR02246 family)